MKHLLSLNPHSKRDDINIAVIDDYTLENAAKDEENQKRSRQISVSPFFIESTSTPNPSLTPTYRSGLIASRNAKIANYSTFQKTLRSYSHRILGDCWWSIVFRTGEVNEAIRLVWSTELLHVPQTFPLRTNATDPPSHLANLLMCEGDDESPDIHLREEFFELESIEDVPLLRRTTFATSARACMHLRETVRRFHHLLQGNAQPGNSEVWDRLAESTVMVECKENGKLDFSLTFPDGETRDVTGISFWPNPSSLGVMIRVPIEKQKTDEEGGGFGLEAVIILDSVGRPSETHKAIRERQLSSIDMSAIEANGEMNAITTPFAHIEFDPRIRINIFQTTVCNEVTTRAKEGDYAAPNIASLISCNRWSPRLFPNFIKNPPIVITLSVDSDWILLMMITQWMITANGGGTNVFVTMVSNGPMCLPTWTFDVKRFLEETPNPMALLFFFTHIHDYNSKGIPGVGPTTLIRVIEEDRLVVDNPTDRVLPLTFRKDEPLDIIPHLPAIRDFIQDCIIAAPKNAAGTLKQAQDLINSTKSLQAWINKTFYGANNTIRCIESCRFIKKAHTRPPRDLVAKYNAIQGEEIPTTRKEPRRTSTVREEEEEIQTKRQRLVDATIDARYVGCSVGLCYVSVATMDRITSPETGDTAIVQGPSFTHLNEDFVDLRASLDQLMSQCLSPETTRAICMKTSPEFDQLERIIQKPHKDHPGLESIPVISHPISPSVSIGEIVPNTPQHRTEGLKLIYLWDKHHEEMERMELEPSFMDTDTPLDPTPDFRESQERARTIAHKLLVSHTNHPE